VHLTCAPAQAKKRIKEILPEPKTALAKPRRIKASHRRRRKVASDHLLYILNNPLSGTDPTGYCGEPALGSNIVKCEEALTETHKNSAGEVIGSKTQRVPNGTIAALTAGQSRSGGAHNGGASASAQNKPNGADLGSQMVGAYNRGREKLSGLVSAIKSRGTSLLGALAPQTSQALSMSEAEQDAQSGSVAWGFAGLLNSANEVNNDISELGMWGMSGGRIHGYRPHQIIPIPPEQRSSAASGELVGVVASAPFVEI